MCIGNNPDADNPINDVVVEASSVANDPVHIAERAVDGGDVCWISDPGVEKVYYKVTYPWYTTISGIHATFCYPVKKFEV